MYIINHTKLACQINSPNIDIWKALKCASQLVAVNSRIFIYFSFIYAWFGWQTYSKCPDTLTNLMKICAVILMNENLLIKWYWGFDNHTLHVWNFTVPSQINALDSWKIHLQLGFILWDDVWWQLNIGFFFVIRMKADWMKRGAF